MSSLNPFSKKKDKEEAQTSSEPTKASETKKEEKEKKESQDAQNDGNPDSNPTAASSEDGKESICQMKRGDYMIHVYIEQAKNLKVPPEETVDPIVQIQCLEERKYTTAQDDINNTGVAIWNEHIFFEPKNKETHELEQGKIIIKMLDKGFYKDALIGYYEFDLAYIYQMPDHSLLHKWIILSNPESENYGEVTAQLKLSITICGEGDEQVGIEDDPNPEKEEMLQPPQIKPKYYQLKFRFFSGQKIVPMDKVIIGKPKTDAYVRLDYKSTKLKTKVMKIEEGGECHWMQEFLVPAQIPILGGRLIFKVFDEDTVKDELIGSIHIEIKDIIGDKNGKFDWKNIYGAPMDCHGKNTDLMNANPEVASFWKGRILMQCLAEETEKPLLLVQQLDDDSIQQGRLLLRPRKYAVSFFVAGALAMPEQDKEYQVSLRIAEKEWNTGPPVMKKAKFNRFNVKPTETDGEFIAPYYNIQDIGTIIIYLKYKGKIGSEKRICFKRLDIMDYLNPNPELRWLELDPDLAIGEVKDHYRAGIVGFKLSIHDIEKDGPINWLNFPQWSKRVSKRPPNLKVRVFCWQARDLPAADDTGSSDPFLQITDCDRSQKTQVIWDNVNPLFYEGLDAIYEANSQEELPPIIVDLYDKDESLVGADGEDFLARALIYVNNINFSTDDSIPVPTWHKLYYKSGGAVSGEVLLSFAIVADDYPFKRTLERLRLEREVEMKEFNIQMQILGLRGLQSAGVLPVKKAFITFNLKSMVPPALGANLNNLKTDPKMPGSDPTLNTLIEFNAPLPRDKLFCPRLSCSVFDNIVQGFHQPLIGTFIIPIGDLMHELAEERISETEALSSVVEEVKKLVNQEFLVNSYKAQKRLEQEAEEAKREEELEKVRINKQFREKLAKKVTHSIQEADDEDVDEPLLGGDYDEELRQSQRLQQKERNALEGANTRLDAETVAKISGQTSRTNSMQQKRTGSVSSSQPGTPQNKFDPKLKNLLMEQQRENMEKAARDVAEAREKAMATYKATSNIVMPQYKRDEKLNIDREFDVPPETLFMGLGWDEDAETKRRHYRRYYPDELENITEIMGDKKSPFNSYDLKRGQARGAKVSFWAKITNNVKTDASGSATDEKIVGRFKAVIEVEAKDEKKAYFARKHELIDELVANLRELAKNRDIKDFDLDLESLESMEGRMAMRQSMEPLGVNHLDVVKRLADIESDVILKRMLLKS